MQDVSRKHSKKSSTPPPPGFPAQLRKLRERYGMSPEALGELCGLSRNTIRRYESGERRPSAETVAKIADFFDISTDGLLGRRRH
nr:MAG TPA: repressor protein [Caudoviricetes sp.]